jgi:hypothetical protein
MTNNHAINAAAVNAAPPAAGTLHAASASANHGFLATAAAHRKINCAAAVNYGYASAALGRVATHLRASARYGFRAGASALRLHDPFFGWGEGVGYRVVRADQATHGLEQGGIKRAAMMGDIQRTGL